MNQEEPRTGTVESKISEQLNAEKSKAEVDDILKRYTMVELCDLVFAKAAETGERIEISIKPPRSEMKKKKKGKDKKKAKKG